MVFQKARYIPVVQYGGWRREVLFNTVRDGDAVSALVRSHNSSEGVIRTEDHGGGVLCYFIIFGILQGLDGVV